jgi:hypothetical protein
MILKVNKWLDIYSLLISLKNENKMTHLLNSAIFLQKEGLSSHYCWTQSHREVFMYSSAG